MVTDHGTGIGIDAKNHLACIGGFRVLTAKRDWPRRGGKYGSGSGGVSRRSVCDLFLGIDEFPKLTPPLGRQPKPLIYPRAPCVVLGEEGKSRCVDERAT